MKHKAPFLIFLSITLVVFIVFFDSEKNIVKLSGAFEAQSFWYSQRVYPNNVLQTDKLVEAHELSKSSLLKNNKVTVTDNWKEIGPHNIGGRTLAIAINPDKPENLWAGSASGGLWKSTTAGEGAKAWEYVSTGFPVMAVSSILIDPADTNIMYIGTGEVLAYQNSIGGIAVRATRGSYGIGILKSTDAGSTWSKSLDWSYDQERGVQGLQFNPHNPSTIFAATSEGTYKSVNSGTTWSQVHNVIMAYDIAINQNDTNQVLVTCGNVSSVGNGIYRSIDGGSSFNKITSGVPTSYGGKALFGRYAKNPEVIFASIGNGYWSDAGTWLCMSSDFGETWETLSTFDYSTYQGWFAHFVVVHPEDSSKLYVAGVDIYKSTNLGGSFDRKSYWYNWYFGKTLPGEPEGPDDYSHADHHAYAFHPNDPNTVYMGTDGGIFKTTDFGESFAGRNGGYQTTQFYNGFVSSLTDTVTSMGGFQDNGSAIYDGTVAWTRVVGGDGSWAAINSDNNSTVYGSSQYLNIARSTDGGNEFWGVAPPSNGSTAFIAPYVICPSDHNVLYAARTYIYRTTNQGDDWTTLNGGSELTPNLPICMSVAYENPLVLYIGAAPTTSSAQIFRTTDGGTTFTNVTGSLPDRYPIDIEVDPNDEATAFICFSGFGTGHVYKTTNYGDSWTDITSNLPDVPTSSIAIDNENSNILYVGNDLGVFASTNGGTDWFTFNEGMRDAAVMMNLSIVRANRTIRVATHGNGAFERKMIDITTSADDNKLAPNSFELKQNYPNPFNPETTIEFSIPNSSSVELIIYNSIGQKVKTLLNGNIKSGTHKVNFNGEGLSSGIYYYRLISNSEVKTQKMILMK